MTMRRHRRYPAEWFDGDTWELDMGKDVPTDKYNATRSLRLAAKRQGKRLRTLALGDKLYIEARDL